jgi:hypothetical protein
MIWPSAALPADAASEPPLPRLEALDAAAFAAGLGPDLSRLFGTRITARPERSARPAAQLLAAATLRAAGDGVPSLDLRLDAAGAATLLERLFGSAGTVPADRAEAQLAALPPGSASWLTACRFLAAAAARALSAAGLAVGGPAQVQPRAAAAAIAGSSSLCFALDIGGAAASLCLVDLQQPAAEVPPAEPPPDPDFWRRRARARALAVDLPVTLRLADTRMALTEVAALKAGDVIPLEQPRAMTVLVAGRKLAEIPAEAVASDRRASRSRRGNPDATDDGDAG